MIDIDHFKKFNDTYGHQTGDKILLEIAKIMKGNIREEDKAFRYGGEEFSVFLPDIDDRAAKIFAERLRKKIEKYSFKSIKNDSLKITISIGICSFNTERESGKIKDVEALIFGADTALYKAKREGRNRVCVYE
jgi:diguanylate cyclase (GGDEF)-like protein